MDIDLQQQKDNDHNWDNVVYCILYLCVLYYYKQKIIQYGKNSIFIWKEI